MKTGHSANWIGTAPLTFERKWQVSADDGATWSDVATGMTLSDALEATHSGKQLRFVEIAKNAAAPDGVPIYSLPVTLGAVVTPPAPTKPVVASNQSFGVSEGATVGATVGTVQASNSPTFFAITGGNSAGRFAISDAGVITLAGLLDYETTTSYALSVTASNAGGTSTAATVTVNVGDVDEGGSGGTLLADGTGIAAAYSGAKVRTSFSGTPLTQAASVVSAWSDQIGTAHFGLGLSSDAPQAGPSYTAMNEAFNNRPTLTFNGTDQHLHTAIGSIPAASDGKIAYVFTLNYSSNQPSIQDYPQPFCFRADASQDPGSDPLSFAMATGPWEDTIWITRGGAESPHIALPKDYTVVVGILFDGTQVSIWIDDTSVTGNSSGPLGAGQILLGGSNVRGGGRVAGATACSISDIERVTEAEFHPMRVKLGAALQKTLTNPNAPPGPGTTAPVVEDTVVWPSATFAPSVSTLAARPPKLDVIGRSGGHLAGDVVEPYVQGFEPGHFPNGAALKWITTAGTVSLQTNVVNRYPDGSARSAVVYPVLPANLAEGVVLMGTLALDTSPPSVPAINLATALANRPCVVTVRPPGDTANAFNFDVRAALSSALPAYTRSGKTETRVRIETMVPASATGGQTGMRLVVDIGAASDGTMHLDAGWASDVAGGNNVVAEYEAIATMDNAAQPVISYSVTGAKQYTNKRFQRERITKNGVLVKRAHALPDWWYQARAAICHRFDVENGVQGDVNTNALNNMAQPWWEDPLNNRGIAWRMPNSGARGDLGWWPKWANDAICGRTVALHDYAVGLGEAALGIPYHEYDFTHKKAVDWRDSGTNRVPNFPPQRGNGGDPFNSGWQLDIAHAPDCGSYAWFSTARLSMLDEVIASAAFAQQGNDPYARTGTMLPEVGGGSRGMGGQVRGQAWCGRALDNAADFACDGTADQARFRAVSAAMWNAYQGNIPEWTTKFGATKGRIDGTYEDNDGRRWAPWQQGYHSMYTSRAVKRGIVPARALGAYIATWIVGAVNHETDGWNPHNYVANKGAQKNPDVPNPGGAYVTTYADLQAAFVAAGCDQGTGWFEGIHQQIGLVMLSMGQDMLDAGITEFAGVDVAYQKYKDMNPQFTGPRYFRGDGTFNVISVNGQTRLNWRDA